LALMKENDIEPDQIEEVILGIDEGALQYVEPVSVKHYPKTTVDLQFSIPYNVANAIVNRKVTFEHYTEKALERKDVLDFLATKVRSWVDPELNFDDVHKGCTAARIQIKTKDGKIYVKRVDKSKGHFTNPMSMDEIIEKFWDCAELSARQIPKKNLNRLIDLITDLENVRDVTSLVSLLA
jgi:2-methylcitrate dehydratase PrpD